jgi:Methenyl tetrahydrofolate cyclohydrolase
MAEGVSEEELIDIAVRSMGLGELKPFVPKEKVIELKIESAETEAVLGENECARVLQRDLERFARARRGFRRGADGSAGRLVRRNGRESFAGKRGWDDKLEYFSDWAVKAQQLKDELLSLVDEDTNAFNKVMDAFALAKNSPEEKRSAPLELRKATKHAAEVPLKVMETAAKSYELLSAMADNGNPASVSDVGVGALATRACIEGAAMNVRINLGH